MEYAGSMLAAARSCKLQSEYADDRTSSVELLLSATCYYNLAIKSLPPGWIEIAKKEWQDCHDLMSIREEEVTTTHFKSR